MSTMANSSDTNLKRFGHCAPPLYVYVKLSRDEVFERIRSALPTPAAYRDHGSRHKSGVIGECTADGFWVARLENWSRNDAQPDLHAIVAAIDGGARITMFLTIRKNSFRFVWLTVAILLGIVIAPSLALVGAKDNIALTWFYRLAVGVGALFVIYSALNIGLARGHVSFDMIEWTRNLFRDVETAAEAPFADAESDQAQSDAQAEVLNDD